MSSGCVGVGVEKAADRGIIIPALQVVQTGLGIKVIAAVADGVDAGHRAAGAEQLAPGVVAVVRDLRPANSSSFPSQYSDTSLFPCHT